MNRLRILGVLVAALLMLGHAQAEDWLSGHQLRELVAGKTAVCRHISRPSSGRTYFAPDGSMVGIRNGKPRSGSWSVRENTLCTNWGKRTICSRYRSDGQQGHYKFTLRGKRTVHIRQWLEGNRVQP